MKKVMIVDDSALMRRVESDILTSDGRFEVGAVARNGREALDILEHQSFDVILLDINMPIMDGIQFMEEINKRGSGEKVVISSTLASEGGSVTIRALELGAVDFIQKPSSAAEMKDGSYVARFLEIVDTASKMPKHRVTSVVKNLFTIDKTKRPPSSTGSPGIKTPLPARRSNAKKIVAIASSTGGPAALQKVIPLLPSNLDAPVLLVQHMPKGFTKSLAERLDSCSNVSVKEAVEGDVPEKGHVYIARGGSHMVLGRDGAIHYTDEPPREGVKPCANYMYESLIDSRYEEIVCVVMTGMGQDGTNGITNLKKIKRNLFCITQTEETCSVYGMPKAADRAGLSNKSVELGQIAGEITAKVGVFA